MNLKIFKNNIKDKYKLLNLKIKEGKVGKTNYFPSFNKEWKNTVYYYNKNSITNFSIDNINIYKLIKNYLYLSFRKSKFIKSKYIKQQYKAFLLKRIYLSKPQIKYFSNKIIITLFSYDVKTNFLLYKKLNNYIKYFILKKYIWFFIINISRLKRDYFKFLVKYPLKRELILYKYKILNQLIINFNFYLSIYLYLIRNSRFKFILLKKIKFYRKHNYKYDININKFEKVKFLPLLTKLLNKFVNKKIEYNIINLKSIIYSSDIFVKILSLKIRNNIMKNIMRLITKMLNKTNIIKTNNIINKMNLPSYITHNYFENRYKNLNLVYILKTFNFDEHLNRLYLDTLKDKVNYYNYSARFFNKIKYKEIRGIKLMAKGRLTKRYRADKSVYIYKSSGGFRDIDSSFKGLSSIMYRNNTRPNVIYSMQKDQRRIGSFAVKGWLSSK